MDKTDRQFFYRPWHASLRDKAARARWLEANDVHTQFVDAGIGCVWFAQQGDQEPVCGESEYEAIVRLAHEYGIELRGRAPVSQPGAARGVTVHWSESSVEAA